MHRQGSHQFLLVFPDGNRRVVPVAWTDGASDGANDRVAHAAHTLAGIADLLQTRTIVDALLRRLETEEEHATEPRLSEEPDPGPDVWAVLEDEQRMAVFDLLERLIAQAARPEPAQEDDDE